MQPLTEQQVYNNALFGMRGQNYEPSRIGDACLYRGPRGLKCAIGHSIPDDIYCPEMDRGVNDDELTTIGHFLKEFTFSSLCELFQHASGELLTALQVTHDQLSPFQSTAERKDQFEARMRQIASCYRLEYSPPAG